MLLSLGVVVLMMAGVGLTGMCSFERGQPENMPVISVDPETFLTMEARSADFPIVNPQVPANWTPNSVRRAFLGEKTAAVVGYVIAGEGYIQLTQTSLDIPKAVRENDPNLRELSQEITVDATPVQIYTSADKDPEVRDIWALRTPAGATVLLSGAATEKEFETLISLVLKAAPLGAKLAAR